MSEIYKKMKHFVAVLAVLGMALGGQMLQAQCNINTSTPEGCFGVATTFSSNASNPDSLVWTYPTGSTNSNQPSLILPTGSNQITVDVYKGGVKVCSNTINYNVNKLPVSDFELEAGYKFSQCYTGNLFCFRDKSTLDAGNTVAKRILLYGDFSIDSSNIGGGLMCHTYALPAGGWYTVEQRIIDNKGCIGDNRKIDYVYVDPDIIADFNHNSPLGCKQTTIHFNNTTALTFAGVKDFTWDWGDGSTYKSDGSLADRCYWDDPAHTYTAHGCFDVTLYVENDTGCKDTLIRKNYACNVNPDMTIFEAGGKDGQCLAGNLFTFTHNVLVYPNWTVSFLWEFDDPPTMQKNFDFQNFTGATHEFSEAKLFTPKFTGNIMGCPFAAQTNVLVKGPGATIENKKIPDIIADSQRHQCNIKDTVYFTNNSAYFLNDTKVMNDTMPTAMGNIYKGGNAFLAKIPTTFLMDTVETVIDKYLWKGVNYLVLASPLKDPALSQPFVVDNLIKYNNFFGAVYGEKDDEHVRTVWDFGDDDAPNCTTWTNYMQNVWDFNKPVYHWFDPNYIDPISGNIGYSKFYRGNAERATEPDQSKFIDTTYEWMNCRYSRDIIPKHWFTPGTEKCFIVKLTMKDTTFDKAADSINYANGGVFRHDYIRFGPETELDSIFKYEPLRDGNGDTVFIYNPDCVNEKTGYQPDLTKPKTLIRVDTKAARTWINPDVQSGDACETENTLMLALSPPNASGMKYRAPEGVCFGPAPPYGIYFDWSETKPGCTQQFVWLNYDSTYDRKKSPPLDAWVPQDAFMLDPMTPWPMATMGMPTWPTTAFRNYDPYDKTGGLAAGSIGDSCGYITVGLRILNGKNPGTNQPCIDEKWYHNMLRYVPINTNFTLDKGAGCNPLEVKMTLVNELQDSLVAMVYRFSDTKANPDTGTSFMEIDSVYRKKYDPITGDTINYILTWRVDDYGNKWKVDSTSFIPGVGGISACGSELRLKKERTLTFMHQGRYSVQVNASTTDQCRSVSGDIVMIGFWKDAWSDKTIICRNETVEFTDSAKYFLKYPDATGNPFLLHPYWRKPNEAINPDNTPRTWPAAKRETVRWDFRQDDLGWVFMPAAPKVAFRLPGYYEVLVEFRDSLGCADTVTIPITVTGTSAYFGYNMRVENCLPIVEFTDSSLMFDPCYLKDGYRCDSIIKYSWDFGDGGTFVTTYTPNGPPNLKPANKYRGYGDYNVRLIVETALGCKDTIIRTINIEGPTPRFEFAIDSIGCVPFTVYLKNTSVDPNPNAYWVWNFGDSITYRTESDTMIYHPYNSPGTYKVSVMQFEKVNLPGGGDCQDTFPKFTVKEVKVLPQRKVNFIADRFEVCPNEPVTFTDKSDSIFTKYTWIFGDGDTLVGDKKDTVVRHAFKATGIYTVRLNPEYVPDPGDPLCGGSKTIQIVVRDVSAEFTVDSANMPIFYFDNVSQNGKNYWWNFDDGNGYVPCPQVDPINCPDGRHDFGDKVGMFNVCLIAQSPEGCYDTVCHMVNNTFEVDFDVPNVFTPNGDGVNDNFEVEVKGWVSYKIEIFSRNGDKVFSSTDPTVPWNGKNFNTGAPNTAGVYYVVITYQLRGQSEKTYNGTVTLIR